MIVSKMIGLNDWSKMTDDLGPMDERFLFAYSLLLQ